MSHRPSRAHVRRLALGLSLALLAASLAVPALADDGPKTYTAVVAPDGGDDAQVCADLDATFALKLTNTSSQQQLGSANITPGFTVRDVSIDGAGSISGSVDTIELRNLGLAPEASVVVTFSGTPAAGVYPFVIVAKQANNFRGSPGNNLTPSGDPASVTVTDCDLSLEFVTQPGDSEVGQLITGPPTVKVVDADDNPVSGVSITMSLKDNALSGELTNSGVPATPTTDGEGLAIFDALSIDEVGNGYVLTASADGLTSVDPVDSDPFNVLYDISECASGDPCEATAEPREGFTLSASGTATGTKGQLSIGVGDGTSGRPGCETPEGVTLNTLPESVILDGQGLTDKQVVFTIGEDIRKFEENNGVSTYQICAEPLGVVGVDTLSFVDRYTGNLVVGQEPYNVPAGIKTQIRGFLPDCKTGVDAPCVAGRSGSGNGGVAITMNFGSRFMT